MKIEQIQDACPNCGNTTFKAYVVIAKDFFKIRFNPNSSNDLIFQLHVCSKCGWKSHLTDEEGIKKTISVALFAASTSDTSLRAEILKENGIPQFVEAKEQDEGKTQNVASNS